MRQFLMKINVLRIKRLRCSFCELRFFLIQAICLNTVFTSFYVNNPFQTTQKVNNIGNNEEKELISIQN